MPPKSRAQKTRFACFYLPDGVPMPLAKDPAHKDWSWFPHGNGKKFTFTKCLEPLEPLRSEVTVFSGLSHPSVRSIHGHSNADQFLTGAGTGPEADTGTRSRWTRNLPLTSEIRPAFRLWSCRPTAAREPARCPHPVVQPGWPRHSGPSTGRNRSSTCCSSRGRRCGTSARLSQSALDDLLADARSLRRTLSGRDQKTLDEYLQSVRDTEIKVEKAKRWMNIPLPKVDVDHLKLDITPEDPKVYLQTMFELIYLAFKTDSTRVATYQLGRENGVGISDYLARAVGFNLTHQLSHNTKNPGGWKNFGVYCRFISEELGRFINKLKTTPEPAGKGNMLDNTLVLFGSASSAFHLSRNYPLILAGGKNMGFKHGQYLNYAGDNPAGGPWNGGENRGRRRSLTRTSRCRISLSPC
ncbi:MAG: hypothetical protein Ct9H300mP1_06490 [Planctomycetaceae bacterium]|nr:MAG: hypothetical protein Ct9H300mP1_06490 [Planctomycetaceae bacterium]